MIRSEEPEYRFAKLPHKLKAIFSQKKVWVFVWYIGWRRSNVSIWKPVDCGRETALGSFKKAVRNFDERNVPISCMAQLQSISRRIELRASDAGNIYRSHLCFCLSRLHAHASELLTFSQTSFTFVHEKFLFHLGIHASVIWAPRNWWLLLSMVHVHLLLYQPEFQ